MELRVLRKDLTAHQGVCPLEHVACPFSDIGCKVKVPRRDLDKHIQSSMLQHMTDMALSHTATKTQLTALKQEHEALKKDHAALKENNRAKMKATALFLKGQSNEYASTVTADQLYTLLVDTSTLEKGSTLSLALSESNTESGHHYIILEVSKFKIEWERQHQRQQHQLQGPQIQYIIRLYLVSNERIRRCRFDISLSNSHPQKFFLPWR